MSKNTHYNFRLPKLSSNLNKEDLAYHHLSARKDRKGKYSQTESYVNNCKPVMNDVADKRYKVNKTNLKPQPNFLVTMFVEKQIPPEILQKHSKAYKAQNQRRSQLQQAQLHEQLSKLKKSKTKTIAPTQSRIILEETIRAIQNNQKVVEDEKREEVEYSTTKQIHVANKSQFKQTMRLVNKFYGAPQPNRRRGSINLNKLKSTDISTIERLSDNQAAHFDLDQTYGEYLNKLLNSHRNDPFYDRKLEAFKKIQNQKTQAKKYQELMLRRLSNNSMWVDKDQISYSEALIDDNIEQLRSELNN